MENMIYSVGSAELYDDDTRECEELLNIYNCEGKAVKRIKYLQNNNSDVKVRYFIQCFIVE